MAAKTENIIHPKSDYSISEERRSRFDDKHNVFSQMRRVNIYSLVYIANPGCTGKKS